MANCCEYGEEPSGSGATELVPSCMKLRMGDTRNA
jgi:hypothetical protein